MGKKDLLIIGAGENQMSIIKAAKSQGYHVCAVSPNCFEPGAQYADELLNVNIFDFETVLKYAKEKDVAGVTTDQSDMATPIVAKLAEELGLPGIGYENALYFTDKSKMRELFCRLDLPVAPNRSTTDVESAVFAAKDIGYPVVIKPVDSFASRGVYKVDDEAALRDKYTVSMDISKLGEVIVEKYISGPQYFTQGYVENSKLRLFAFSDRYYFDIPDVFLPYTNAFPAKISNNLKLRMTDYFEKIISYLRPPFGQVWAEWIYDDKNDVLYLIEMASRGAGAFVTTDVIPNAYGVDTQVYLVNDAMGNRQLSFSDAVFTEKAAAFFCFLVPPGKVISVEGLERVSSIPGVVKANIRQLKPGDITLPYKDKSSRFGPIVVKGDTRDDLDLIRLKLMETIKIVVKTDEGNKEAIWE